MSHVPTVLKSDRSVFDKMLPVDDNGFIVLNDVYYMSSVVQSGRVVKAYEYYQTCIATKTFEFFGFLGEARKDTPNLTFCFTKSKSYSVKNWPLVFVVCSSFPTAYDF